MNYLLSEKEEKELKTEMIISANDYIRINKTYDGKIIALLAIIASSGRSSYGVRYQKLMEDGCIVVEDKRIWTNEILPMYEDILEKRVPEFPKDDLLKIIETIEGKLKPIE